MSNKKGYKTFSSKPR